MIEFEGDVSIVHQVLSVAVRLVGVAVLFIGVWAGVKVIIEAWSLYQEPTRIVQFAQAIESGSNLDQIFAASTEGPQDTQAAGAAHNGLKLSYFAAWFIVLLLLMVIGSLAMSAITTGGRLVLYDSQVKKLSRAVIRELVRYRPS